MTAPRSVLTYRNSLLAPRKHIRLHIHGDYPLLFMELKVFNQQTAALFDDTEIYRTYTYWFYRQFPSVNEFPGFSGNDRACANSRYQAVFLLPRSLGTRLTVHSRKMCRICKVYVGNSLVPRPLSENPNPNPSWFFQRDLGTRLMWGNFTCAPSMGACSIRTCQFPSYLPLSLEGMILITSWR